MSRLVRAFRLVHPFPSFLNAVVVFGLAQLAGADMFRSTVLGGGMLGVQFCIGALNDVADAPADATVKPWKPVASGLVSRSAALSIAAVAGGVGLLLSALVNPVALVLVALLLASGVAYDFVLKPTVWAWVCFALAFQILPLYAWIGAAGVLPPRPELLLPLAAIAAPALQLANGLTDIEDDRKVGIPTLASRLGRRRTLLIMATALAVLHATAWLTLAALPGPGVLLIAAASTVAAIGLGLSGAASRRLRQVGWIAQTVALALLALGWVSAAV